MNTLRTRIARLTAASVLALGLGALGAGPVLANDHTRILRSTDSVTLSANDDASTDGTGVVPHSGIKSVEDAES